MEKGFVPVNSTDGATVRIWFGCMHESRKGRQVTNCRLFLDDGKLDNARQINSLFCPYGQQKLKKEEKNLRWNKWEDQLFHELSLAFERTHRSKKDFFREERKKIYI